MCLSVLKSSQESLAGTFYPPLFVVLRKHFCILKNGRGTDLILYQPDYQGEYKQQLKTARLMFVVIPFLSSLIFIHYILFIPIITHESGFDCIHR